MGLDDRLSKALKHPILRAAVEAAQATRDGLRTAISGGSGTERSMAPEAWGPTDGPAPVENTKRSPVVRFNLDIPRVLSPAEVQFWAPRCGGAILAAWEIGGQSGTRAVFERDAGRLWLDRPCMPTPENEYTHVNVDNIEDELWDAFTALMARHRTQSLGVETGPTRDKDGLTDPAPDDQHQAEPVSGTVTNGSSVFAGRFQPWCSEDGTAVYISWQIGRQSGHRGVLHASGLWIGHLDDGFEFPEGVRVPFLYVAADEVRESLESRAAELRDSAVGEGIVAEEHVETERSSHPEAPSRKNPWSGNAESGA